MADWDFVGANTKRMTHGIHPYPAMMIPQIAARLIDSYGRGARVLFDPFCGAGASLLEANLRGINAVGADLNPLARLIARVKTAPIEAGKLKRRLRRVNDAIFHARFDANPKIPPIANIDFWFSPAVQRNLAVLRAIIDAEADAATRRFLAVAFSETVRECSYTRNGEFKLYRIPAARRESFAPDVFGSFVAKLARNFAAMERFAAAKIRARSRILDLDSAQTAPSIKADLIVTSPPYGDSKTTVAYGQFSRLANEWLGIENAAAIDRKMLGGSPQKKRRRRIGLRGFGRRGFSNRRARFAPRARGLRFLRRLPPSRRQRRQNRRRGRTRLLCRRQPPRQRNRIADGPRDARLFCRQRISLRSRLYAPDSE